MALPINQVKPGMFIVWNGRPYQVVSSSHLKLGRGRGIQQVRVQSLVDGSRVEHRFRGNEVVEEAEIERRRGRFLYTDPTNAYFMADDYDEFSLPRSTLGKKTQFLKAGEPFVISYFKEQAFDIELPIKMTFAVTDSEPGLRGDRVSAGTKPATIETGAKVQVPLHIKPGDEIVVDTRDGSYVARAKI